MKLDSRLACVLLVSACGTDGISIPEVRSELPRNENPSIAAATYQSFVADNNAFAAELYRQVRDEAGNLFMSPYSISSALAMTYAGAVGTTATELADTLHFTLPPADLHSGFNRLELDLASRENDASNDSTPFKLRVANSLWGQKDFEFLSPFLDTLAVNYGAGLFVLDFARDTEGSRETINTWVEQQTNDKIKNLLPQGAITDNTKLVLTNAIYFKAAWDNAFEASQTKPDEFFVGGAPVQVDTLHQVAEHRYGAGDGWQATELLYDGGKLGMVIVLPEDLATFESTIDGAQLAAIESSLVEHSVTFSVPKFKYEAPLPLKKHLQALGMNEPFSDTADFSGMDGRRDLFIHDVLHKGFVGIDEKGTEAAAATAVIVGDASAPESATMLVNRPFMFYIRDIPTGQILFLGRVRDPR